MALPTEWESMSERDWNSLFSSASTFTSTTNPLLPFVERRRESTVSIYRGRIDHQHFSPTLLQCVRDYIIGVSLDANARWNSGHATVQINDVIYRVMKGSIYEKRESSSDPIIYLCHTPGCARPDWLVGVLSALAQYYGIDQEPGIVDAIIKIAVQGATAQFTSVPGTYVAATFSGVEVRDIAIKMGTNLVAGLCPPETEGGLRVWRLRETGEIVNPTREDGWVTFPITGGD